MSDAAPGLRPAIALGVLLCCLLPTAAVASEGGWSFGDDDWLHLYSDFRFRLESDFDSRQSDGTERDDRLRARVRARLGIRFLPGSRWIIDLRLRTGSHHNQQSSHLTIHDFDGNPTGEAEVLPDRWYAQYKGERWWAWAGRNGFPFWMQNEMLWDADVIPAGLAAGVRVTSSVSLTGGYFTVPDGAVHFLGELAAVQIVYSATHGKVDWTAAAGALLFDGEEGARLLRNGNGARDYTILVASAQARWSLGGRPLALGVDLMTNRKNYDDDDADAFTAAHHDETDGFVIQATYGQVKDRNQWLAGYVYGYIEALAVHASYAQDNWVRWGSGGQTDSSDLKGHEFRFDYGIRKNVNVVARLFFVDAISSVQDGKRFRIDLNWKP